MSTRNKQRAKKAVLLLLGVSSVATLGLVVSQANIDQNENLDDNTLEPVKMNNFDSESSGYISTMKGNENNIDNTNIEVSKNPPDGAGTVSEDLIAMNLIPNIEEFEKVKVLATGYTAGVESTGKDPSHPEYGITYSGTRVRRDVYSTIAADLNVFPLGTILYIPDYGFGVVADIGSAINGKEIDLYFETVDEVYESWGKKYVEIYVIKRGDGKVDDSLLDYYNKVAMANTVM